LGFILLRGALSRAALLNGGGKLDAWRVE